MSWLARWLGMACDLCEHLITMSFVENGKNDLPFLRKELYGISFRSRIFFASQINSSC